MAKYRAKPYAEFLYGGQTAIPLSVSPMTVLVRTSSEAVVTWKKPTGDFTRIRLVRNQGGYPETFEDGAVVWEERSTGGETTRTSITDGVDNPETIPFVAGRMLYYRMFLFTAEKEWRVAGFASALVPYNHEFQEKLFGVLPRVFTSIEQTQLGELDTRVIVTLSGDTDLDEGVIYDFNTFRYANESLSTQQIKAEGRYVNDLLNFLGGLGFTLDELVTYLELTTAKHSAFDTPASLLPIQFSHLGLTPEPTLPIKNQKKLVRETNYLYTKRGTKEGIEGYIEALTGYDAKVTVSQNMLLTPQDSTFYKSTGNWVVSPEDTIEPSTEVTPINKIDFVNYPVLISDNQGNYIASGSSHGNTIFVDRIDDEYTCKLSTNTIGASTSATAAKIIIYGNDVPTTTGTGSQSALTVKSGMGLGDGTSLGELTGKTNIPTGTYTFTRTTTSELLPSTYSSSYSSQLPVRDLSNLSNLPINDDAAYYFILNFYVKIGNVRTNQISILNNGGVAIGQNLGSFTWTPSALTTFNYPMVWGLWYDIDTCEAGTVKYGHKTDADGKRYFQISWVDVGYYSCQTTNLTNFDIFLYEDTQLGDVTGTLSLGEDDPIKKGIPIKEDTVYAANAMFYVADSTVTTFNENLLKLGVKFFDKNGTFISSRENVPKALRGVGPTIYNFYTIWANPFGVTNKWNPINNYFKTPPKAAYLSIYFKFKKGKTIYLDTVSLIEQGPAANFESLDGNGPWVARYPYIQYSEPKVNVWLRPTEYNYLAGINKPILNIEIEEDYCSNLGYSYNHNKFGGWYDFDLIKRNNEIAIDDNLDFSDWEIYYSTGNFYNGDSFSFGEERDVTVYPNQSITLPPYTTSPGDVLNPYLIGPQISLAFNTDHSFLPEEVSNIYGTSSSYDFVGDTAGLVVQLQTESDNWKVKNRQFIDTSPSVIENTLPFLQNLDWWHSQDILNSYIESQYLWTGTNEEIIKKTQEDKYPITNSQYYTFSFYARGSTRFKVKLTVWGYDVVYQFDETGYMGPLNISEDYPGLCCSYYAESGFHTNPDGGPTYTEPTIWTNGFGGTNTQIAQLEQVIEPTTIENADGWNRYQMTFLVPSEADAGPIRLMFADISLEADELGNAGDEAQICGIVLEKGFKASEYFLGYAKYPSLEQKVSRLAYTMNEWLPANCWWSIRSYYGVDVVDRGYASVKTYYDYATHNPDPNGTAKVYYWAVPWESYLGLHYNNLMIE